MVGADIIHYEKANCSGSCSEHKALGTIKEKMNWYIHQSLLIVYWDSVTYGDEHPEDWSGLVL